MQLNFLQEDLLELMQQDKPAAPPLALRRNSCAPVQPSLLADVPPPVKTPEAKERQGKPAEAIAHLPEEKAPAAFKTISEAAEILGVPAYVLRFWESQFSQVRPTKSRGGRRYYRPEDMEVLATIKTLLYKEGYTIKGARKAFAQVREDIEAAPVSVQPARPTVTPRQKSQLAAVRSELLALREQLLPYLPA